MLWVPEKKTDSVKKKELWHNLQREIPLQQDQEHVAEAKAG